MRSFHWLRTLGIRPSRTSQRRLPLQQSVVECCEVRRMLTGSIAGVLFADSNADGDQIDESALENVNVFLDRNGDGIRQPATEPIKKTGPGGTFTFDNLPAGKYRVALDPTSFPQGSRVTNSLVFTQYSTSTFSVTGTPNSVVSLDVDNLNGPDLIAVVGTKLVLLKNNGQGSFPTQATIPFSFTPGNLVVGNFDAGTSEDRGMDFAVAATNANKVVVYRNTGGQFVVRNTLTLGATPIMLSAGQLDSDAASELVVTRNNGLEVFLSPTAATTEINHSSISGFGGYVEDATIGNFDDKDGNDIAYLIKEPGTLRIAYNNGKGGFSDQNLSEELLLGSTQASSIASANLDNAGTAEILATTGEGSLFVLNSNLTSAIAAPTLFGGPGAAVVESRDMDGDGLKDILVQVDSDGKAGTQRTLYRNLGRNQDNELNVVQVEQAGTNFSNAPPRGFAVADVDRRGGPDWILVDKINRRLTIRRNQQTAAEVVVVDGQTSEPKIGVQKPTLAISPANVTLSEGAAGQTTLFVFTIKREGVLSDAVTVNYMVTTDSVTGIQKALASDFSNGQFLQPLSTTIAAGSSSVNINIRVKGDAVQEVNKGFAVKLTSSSPGTTIKVGQASGTIVDDD